MSNCVNNELKYKMDINRNDKNNGGQPQVQPKPGESPAQPKDVAATLEGVLDYVGVMGTYQRFLFVAMLPFGFVWAFGYFGIMFLTATPDHWCRVPQLERLDMELRRNLSIPVTASGDYEHCLVYDADWEAVLATLQPPTGAPLVPCQHGWEFHLEDIPYETVVSQREWVCERAYLVPASTAISFLGSIVGGITLGQVADKFGRRAALIGANAAALIGGVGTSFTTGFWDFSACRFLVGTSIDSCFIMIYILVMEYVGTRHRTWIANMSIALYFGGGCLALPFLALWIADWRLLSLVMAAPSFLVVLTPILIPESARWYVSQGKYDKAVVMLKRFERVNKVKIPDDVLADFVAAAKIKEEKREGLGALLRSPQLRLMLVFLVLTFMSCAVVFDILIRLSETLGLDFFLTFAVTSATEIPSIGLLVLLLDRFGRRRMVFFPIVITGILSMVAAFVPRGVPSVALAVVARFFNNMAFNTIIQWTPELLPTGARASGASAVAVSAFAAVMLSPFVVYSERAWESLPLILVALVSALCGGLALLLPETTGCAMPQTIADSRRLADTRPQLCGSKKEEEQDIEQIEGDGLKRRSTAKTNS